ncbi:MAG: SDR family oxidoreductase [Bacteroidota bacterium]
MDKVALVTGGSGGIGSELCRQFARSGYAVIVNYNSNETKAKKVLSELRGSSHSMYGGSITSSDDLTEMAEFVSKKYGKLDVLVNNSGVTQPVPHNDLEGLNDELFDHILSVNVRGTFATIRAFHPLLHKGTHSIVVNISSIAARTGVGSNVAYCASKAAVDSITRSLGRALAPEIRVVSLSPGWVMGEYAANFPPEYIQAQRDKTPLARIAEPGDVGRAIIAVVESLTFTTGCVIPVDGGRPLL